ncbi:MAG: glycosyltransferase family 1 protein [Parvibaculaceae bacterium]|nr:glycosyltransferase family 1 protein [Parvibaculaceae bacterium]
MARTRDIFINGRFLTQNFSGVQRYAREIVLALDALIAGRPDLRANGCTWNLVVPQSAGKLPLTTIRTIVSGRSTSHLWDQTSFAWRARKGVALSLTASGPVLHPRHIVVIHDAAVFRNAGSFGRAYRTFHQGVDHIFARTAQLATVSYFSRGELADVLGVPARDIIVATNGAEHLAIAPDETVVGRLGLDQTPFFVMVGNLTRNKNLAVVVRALNRLKPGCAKLVAVGSFNQSVFGNISLPESPYLVMPGRLSDAEIAGLMRHARALVFPSLYEGFGIPPLEAMVNGCPVIGSTAGAVQEVCGTAIDYFDPQDDGKLAELLARALDDAEGRWRAERIAAGRTRTALYSWQASAQVLAEACLRLAQG